jgi:DNA-binding XRE family transcriptional regulator
VTGLLPSQVLDRLADLDQTQAYLAQMIGVSEKHLSQVMTGHVAGSLPLWESIAKALGLQLTLAAHPAEPAPVASRQPLRELAEWLVKLDDPGSEERREVTLTQIVSAAAAAIVAAEESAAPVANRKTVTDVLREFAQGEPDGENDGWVLFADNLDDFNGALLAAGVFRSEAEVKAEALEEFAREMDEQAALWSTPTNRADIPETWDSHHLIVRNASEIACKNAAKDARAAAARLAAS